MNPNKINPGDKGHSAEYRLHHWRNDMANDLHNNDALWFWAAKASHKFMEWQGRGVMDPVLHCIFAITGGKGVYNQWIHCDLIVIF